MTIIHAGAGVFFNNMHHIKPYLLQYYAWKYKYGVPIHKKPSPCLPYKEHDETKLHIDKSTSFSAEFMESQKEWKCGLLFCIIEVVLSLILILVFTKYKWDNEAEFENKYKHLFEKEI